MRCPFKPSEPADKLYLTLTVVCMLRPKGTTMKPTWWQGGMGCLKKERKRRIELISSKDRAHPTSAAAFLRVE